ncbi:hypothetical protein D9758_009341 [Tetrapyrgos nigripes]|uniref:Uncharacterized protein n=1 Tax=Tetrapyrgos nigripes TaxID=182062 RepID=A0A8H5LPM7_9AGAR|nr:hypothetical protein D9758_009341 [Tetrapyrgos nigripes]
MYGLASSYTSFRVSLGPTPCNSSTNNLAAFDSHTQQPHQSASHIAGCQNCSLYRCLEDDRKFLSSMEKRRPDYGRRFEWLWYCVCWVAPRDSSAGRIRMWRSLVDSEDIWSMWDEGDESQLPPPSSSLLRRECDPIIGIISRRLDLHSRSHCVGKALLSTTDDITVFEMVFEMRYAIILWKSILACRSSKYRLNPSSIDHDLPHLVLRWWDMIAYPFGGSQLGAIAAYQPFWATFCATLSQRGHTCCQGHPQELMWKVWVIIQTGLRAPIPLSLPGHPDCQQCVKLRGSSLERLGSVRAHVLALWCLTKEVGTSDAPCAPTYWKPNLITPSFGRPVHVDLADNILNQVNLCQVDEWLHKLSCDSGYKSLPLFRGLRVPDPRWIPSSWLTQLYKNENDLDLHWSETEVAISDVISSKSPDLLFVPASWICAVVLFAIVNSVGFGAAAAQRFQHFVCGQQTGIHKLLDAAPVIIESEAVRNFRIALENCGHTCWGDKSCGPHSVSDLYSSAYSMLVNTSDVAVVGCEEESQSSDCDACRIKQAVRTLFDAFGEDGLAASMPSSSSRYNAAKRLISKINSHRDQRDRQLLNYDNVKELSESLGRISTTLHQVLDDNAREESSFFSNIDTGQDSQRTEEDGGEEQGHSSSQNTTTHEVVAQVSPVDMPVHECTERLQSHPRSPTAECTAYHSSSIASIDSLVSLDERQGCTLETDHVRFSNITLSTLVEGNRYRPEQFQSLAVSVAQDTFRQETGLSRSSRALRQSKKPRIDRMRFEIKDKFLSILKSHNIDSGNKLPWRSLPNVLRERGYKLQNWPDGIPLPDTQNGIEKAPASQIIAIYDALNNGQRPLGICRIDGSLGRPGETSFIMEDPSSVCGAKRSRSERDEGEDADVLNVRRRMT